MKLTLKYTQEVEHVHELEGDAFAMTDRSSLVGDDTVEYTLLPLPSTEDNERYLFAEAESDSHEYSVSVYPFVPHVFRENADVRPMSRSEALTRIKAALAALEHLVHTEEDA